MARADFNHPAPRFRIHQEFFVWQQLEIVHKADDCVLQVMHTDRSRTPAVRLLVQPQQLLGELLRDCASLLTFGLRAADDGVPLVPLSEDVAIQPVVAAAAPVPDLSLRPRAAFDSSNAQPPLRSGG